jgi:hypothetical protein
MTLAKTYVDDETIKTEGAFELFRVLFEVFNRSKLIVGGYSFFSHFLEIGNSKEFDNSKAYTLYYAYQLRNYKDVKSLLDNFFIELKSKKYLDYIDFVIFNYYKGMVFLSQQVNIKLS